MDDRLSTIGLWWALRSWLRQVEERDVADTWALKMILKVSQVLYRHWLREFCILGSRIFIVEWLGNLIEFVIDVCLIAVLKRFKDTAVWILGRLLGFFVSDENETGLWRGCNWLISSKSLIHCYFIILVLPKRSTLSLTRTDLGAHESIDEEHVHLLCGLLLSQWIMSSGHLTSHELVAEWSLVVHRCLLWYRCHEDRSEYAAQSEWADGKWTGKVWKLLCCGQVSEQRQHDSESTSPFANLLPDEVSFLLEVLSDLAWIHILNLRVEHRKGCPEHSDWGQKEYNREPLEASARQLPAFAATHLLI